MKIFLMAIAMFLAMTGTGMAATATASWTDNSTNEDGFKLYAWKGVAVETGQRQEIAAVGPNVTNTNATFAGLAGENWCFLVTAYNTAGESGFSNVVCLTVPVVVTIPSAPGGLVITIQPIP